MWKSGWCTSVPAKQEGFHPKQLQPTEISHWDWQWFPQSIPAAASLCCFYNAQFIKFTGAIYTTCSALRDSCGIAVRPLIMPNFFPGFNTWGKNKDWKSRRQCKIASCLTERIMRIQTKISQAGFTKQPLATELPLLQLLSIIKLQCLLLFSLLTNNSKWLI